MKRCLCVDAVVAILVLPAALQAANLFSDNFDADPTAAWKINNNGIGTNAADFFFDYSTAGIPSAPHSTGGTTRGLKLGANLTSMPLSSIPGISVSPIGKSFTGDYTLQFDWWHNYIGPLNSNFQVGSTMYSNFGIMTSGTKANDTTTTDGVVFGATGDGGIGDDIRIASPERPGGYLIPDNTGHSSYLASSRDESALLYRNLFPAGATAPGSQVGIPTQTGATAAGNPGFRWHDVKINKLGTLVSWLINDTLVATLETANLSVATAGDNILFGMSDINSTTSSEMFYPQVAFTLIDNVVVNTAPSINPDFNGNGIVDAADYTIWRDNFGLSGAAATQAKGNCSGDTVVDQSDYPSLEDRVRHHARQRRHHTGRRSRTLHTLASPLRGRFSCPPICADERR